MSTNNVLRMVRVSLGVNIAVLIPVCAVLMLNLTPLVDVWGPATPARGILLSIAPLLAMQVCYKVMTPITVGTLANPVVICNIGVAVVHAITLWLIVMHHRASAK